MAVTPSPQASPICQCSGHIWAGGREALEKEIYDVGGGEIRRRIPALIYYASLSGNGVLRSPMYDGDQANKSPLRGIANINYATDPGA